MKEKKKTYYIGMVVLGDSCRRRRDAWTAMNSTYVTWLFRVGLNDLELFQKSLSYCHWPQPQPLNLTTTTTMTTSMTTASKKMATTTQILTTMTTTTMMPTNRSKWCQMRCLGPRWVFFVFFFLYFILTKVLLSI